MPPTGHGWLAGVGYLLTINCLWLSRECCVSNSSALTTAARVVCMWCLNDSQYICICVCLLYMCVKRLEHVRMNNRYIRTVYIILLPEYIVDHANFLSEGAVFSGT